MILSYVCIIIFAATVLSGKAEKVLAKLKLNGAVAQLLLFLSAVATLFPSARLQNIGLDYLSIILMAVALYTIFRSPAKRLVPIFGGIIAIIVMSIVYRLATSQLAIGAWWLVGYIAVMGIAAFIVSRGAEGFCVSVMGMILSQVVVLLVQPLGAIADIQQFGGVVMVVAVVVAALNCLSSFAIKVGDSFAIRAKL